jgi:hypothetical protein
LPSMNFPLLATALCTAVMLTPAAAQSPDIDALARATGTPEIPGLKMVWLASWDDVAKAHPWRNIIVHQTEGPAGSARGGAELRAKNPTRRGVTVWVESDGTVYWAAPETLVPTHRGADRGVANPLESAARALPYSTRARLCAQLDRLQGCALLRRLRTGDPRKAVGGVGDPDAALHVMQRC